MKFKNRFPGIFYLLLILGFAGAGCGGGAEQSKAPVSATTAGRPNQEVGKSEKQPNAESIILAKGRQPNVEGPASARQLDAVSATSAGPLYSEIAPEITIRGKIALNNARGGLYVDGDDPYGPFLIVNKNPKVLGELLDSGNLVTIEGRLTMGATWLFIERIDGRPYQGEEEPVSPR